MPSNTTGTQRPTPQTPASGQVGGQRLRLTQVADWFAGLALPRQGARGGSGGSGARPGSHASIKNSACSRRASGARGPGQIQQGESSPGRTLSPRPWATVATPARSKQPRSALTLTSDSTSMVQASMTEAKLGYQGAQGAGCHTQHGTTCLAADRQWPPAAISSTRGGACTRGVLRARSRPHARKPGPHTTRLSLAAPPYLPAQHASIRQSAVEARPREKVAWLVSRSRSPYPLPAQAPAPRAAPRLAPCVRRLHLQSWRGWGWPAPRRWPPRWQWRCQTAATRRAAPG